MLPLLLATAFAGPHLTVHHHGKVYVQASPSSHEAAAALAAGEATSTHPDEMDHMHVLALPTLGMGDLAVGQSLRSWVDDDRFVDCTVKRFVAEVAGPEQGPLPSPLPEYTAANATFLAELACEGEPARHGWLVAPADPIPYEPSLERLDDEPDTVAEVLDVHQDFLSAQDAFAHQAEDVDMRHDRMVSRFDTPRGHHLLVEGRFYTGEADTHCGGPDLVNRYVAILVDGPAPHLVALHFLGETGSVQAVLDIERDGVLELFMSAGLGDVELVGQEGDVLSRSSLVWWSFCPC